MTLQTISAIDSDNERATHRAVSGASKAARDAAARAERARDRVRNRAYRDHVRYLLNVRGYEDDTGTIRAGAMIPPIPDDYVNVSNLGRERFGYEAMSPATLVVVRRAVASVARTYPGLDRHEIESRAVRLVAIGLTIRPTDDTRRIYGRARYAAKRIAGKLATGRGTMEQVHDAERQPGSPNWASWVALDERGVPVTMQPAGTPHYVAGRGLVPGETRLGDIIGRVNDSRDAAAAILAMDYSHTYTRDRCMVARGTVTIDWRGALAEYVRLTGDRVSVDTFKRRARRAVANATSATDGEAYRRDETPARIELPALIGPVRPGRFAPAAPGSAQFGTCPVPPEPTSAEPVPVRTRGEWESTMIDRYGDRPGFTL